MRFASFKYLMCGILLASYPIIPMAAPADSVEKQIIALEREMNGAYAANDLSKYFSYYADNLSAIFYTNRSTLPEYREFWTKSVKEGNLVLAFKMSDIKVRVLAKGMVVLASYQADVSNQLASGKTTSEHAFETDVWTKSNGTWKVEFVHYAIATPPPK